MTIALIFPHQLFAQHPLIQADEFHLIEDPLFFGDYRYPAKFHKQKLVLHRASMQAFADQLRNIGKNVTYHSYRCENMMAQVLNNLDPSTVSNISVVDPTDFVLEKRLRRAVDKLGWQLEVVDNPNFINTKPDNQAYRASKKRWFMADFYKWQRQRLDILMDDGQPRGGQWSYDEDNRKKLPKDFIDDLPSIDFDLGPDQRFIDEAIDYVSKKFPNNPGNTDTFIYPISHVQAERWLDKFLTERLSCFGPYEDAIEPGQNWLYHSILTPMLNIGLLCPKRIIDKALNYVHQHDVPLSSLEGFVRQIIGWREFMRATYEDLGVTMRNRNYWQHNRDIPDSLYHGTTGVDPVDNVIKRLHDHGYCHHIERLMVLGGFMFLCEISPQQIYRWFMEMFVDSYDWVMVPNVYSMSQNADGGLITTKPYFSGSNYVRKMSHYPKGDWCDIWDGLYWRWIINHADDLRKNPRWAMMVRMADKMDPVKKVAHLETAEDFLKSLST